MHPVASGRAYSAEGLEVSNCRVFLTPTTRVRLALRYFSASVRPGMPVTRLWEVVMRTGIPLPLYLLYNSSPRG